MPVLIEKQILATIVYYDIFDYPLTSLEVFSYLIEVGAGDSRKSENSMGDILECLENNAMLKNRIDVKFGFFFLRGRSEIVAKRMERKKIADQKWKRAKRIFRIIQAIPFLRNIFVSGSLALGNSREDSDIDIMIVAEKGRIWTVRVLVTILTAVLGVRRHKKDTENKICLNHYITDQSLRIPFQSIYNAQSYIHLKNVFDSEGDKEIFEKFQIENNWIRNYAVNYQSSELGTSRSVKRNGAIRLFSGIFEYFLSGSFGDLLERKLSSIQSNKIKSNPFFREKGGRVTINDDQLEFHPESHESRIIPDFNKRMRDLGLFEFSDQKDSGLIR
jgi:predicted nucleotidyltransferase